MEVAAALMQRLSCMCHDHQEFAATCEDKASKERRKKEHYISA